ncbi:MAG: histidine--tRNA ligase [Alphaproteobacteria bacterium]
MSDKKKIYKPRPISGFPEWLPETRRAEQAWFDHIRRVFESYGFCNIETPSVEELDAINAKGGDGEADADKEIYVIERLHKELNYEIVHKDDDVPKHYTLIPINDPNYPDHKLYETSEKEARLALHFDQTVPLARYTAQHFNELVFPFKRYQMQRVWRGERPQAGRFREFYQCDIDVINVDSLPQHFDAEMPAIVWEILSSLPGMENENIQIRISNRKILIGLLNAYGVTDKNRITEYTRLIDKLEKKGVETIYVGLKLNLKLDTLDENFADAFIELASIKATSNNFSRLLHDFIARNDVIARSVSNEAIQTLNEGIKELSFVMDQLSHLPEGAVVADLSIVRGLDYYTGTVYETVFLDDPSYGSICSGGRYDDLAGNYINRHLPGVGISIGFSRLFERIRLKGNLPNLGTSPAAFLVVAESEDELKTMNETAQSLRANGHNVETWHRAENKLKRPLAYAEKKGIRYIWLLPNEERETHEIKDMVERTQNPTTMKEWTKND